MEIHSWTVVAVCVSQENWFCYIFELFSLKFWMILSFVCFSRCFSHDCFIGWFLRPILGWETEFVAFFVWSYCAVHPCFPSCPNWTPLACSLIWMQFYPYRATTVHKYYPNFLSEREKSILSYLYSLKLVRIQLHSLLWVHCQCVYT